MGAGKDICGPARRERLAGRRLTLRSLLATAPRSSAGTDGHARPAATLLVLSGLGGGAVTGPALQGAQGD